MSGPPVSRRTAVRWAGVLSVAGAASLSGCDLDPRSSPTPAAAPPPDHDERILLAARAELTGLIARLRVSLVSPHPAAVLVDLEQAHLTQLAALDGRAPSPSSPGVRVRALRAGPRLVAREALAVSRFTTWAERAVSGDLARVLAATAAGIRTQLSGAGLR